jgi:glycosyltransferase involved in cell wall biosynthesis
MKILLLTNMYPSEQAPNYGVFVQRTEKILKGAGHKIILVELNKKFSSLHKLMGYFLYVLRFFIKTQLSKPDVIYVHYASQNAKLILLMKKWKPLIPIILNTHGTDILPQSKAQEKYQPDVQKMMKEINHVIVPSTYYQQIVKEKYNFQGPITIFPSGGVNTEFFKANREMGKDFKDKLSIQSEKIVISYISRIDPHKGWDTLLESASILKLENPYIFSRVHFIVAGSGSQDQQLDAKIIEFGLLEIMTRQSMLTQSEMKKAFNASDIFCFPSAQESLGLVGLEAMATGLPLLASDIPGTKDYVNDQNAIVFEPNNARDLAKAIETYVYLSSDEKNALSQNARNTSLRFDSKTVSGKLLTVFEDKNKNEIESERGLNL